MAEYIHYVYNICQSYTLHTFPTLCSHILKCNRSHHEKKTFRFGHLPLSASGLYVYGHDFYQ